MCYLSNLPAALLTEATILFIPVAVKFPGFSARKLTVLSDLNFNLSKPKFQFPKIRISNSRTYEIRTIELVTR
jgi:hypothetical protein